MARHETLTEAVKFSNLRARLKLYNREIVDPGSMEDNDHGFVQGVDVWLDDLAKFTLNDFQDWLQPRFAETKALETFIIAFHFETGARPEEVAAFFERDGRLKLQSGLDGGIPYPLDEAIQMAEQAFTRVGLSVDDLNHGYADAELEIEEDYWFVTLSANDQSVTLEEIRKALQAARSSLCSFRGTLGADQRNLLRRRLLEGQFMEVTGTAECEWLEFKSELTLGSRHGNNELIKAVTAFANGHCSSMLVVGVGTERRDGQDKAAALTPLPARVHTEERYRDIIDSHVVPLIRGLRIEIAEMTKEEVLVIVTVPAQREQDKPFVALTKVGSGSDRHEVQTVYLRRGGGTVRLNTANLQALLSAGYRTLREEN
ncbi:helix-turn-helix domain-containing protein [Amycolatopsis lurida]